jgi:hypothetical protein
MQVPDTNFEFALFASKREHVPTAKQTGHVLTLDFEDDKAKRSLGDPSCEIGSV